MKFSRGNGPSRPWTDEERAAVEAAMEGIPTTDDDERAMMRAVLWVHALAPTAGMFVAAAHGMPRPVAMLLGLSSAAAYIALSLSWDPTRRWRWPAVAFLAVVQFFPALVWSPWIVFACVNAFVPLLTWSVLAYGRRGERRLVEGPPTDVRVPRSVRKELRKRYGKDAV